MIFSINTYCLETEKKKLVQMQVDLPKQCVAGKYTAKQVLDAISEQIKLVRALEKKEAGKKNGQH